MMYQEVYLCTLIWVAGTLILHYLLGLVTTIYIIPTKLLSMTAIRGYVMTITRLSMITIAEGISLL